jgi:hypothetical protein
VLDLDALVLVGAQCESGVEWGVKNGPEILDEGDRHLKSPVMDDGTT